MNKIFLDLVPIIIIFIFGIVLKKFNILKRDDGSIFLKVIFYLTLPALIIFSIPKIKLSGEMIFLPLTAIWIILITFFISFFISKRLNLGNQSLGVFLVGSMIMEVSFALPFILTTYGQEGLARIVLFDMGNTIMAFSFVYFIACRHSKNKESKSLVKKIIFSPPLLASLFAILFNLTNLQLPTIADNTVSLIGNLTTPLIVLSLGIYFNPKIAKIIPTSFAVFIRMFVGLLVGLILIKIFNFEGLTKSIVIIASSAPICYNTLTFSSLEDLDKDFAANLISFSILIGFILIPLLLWILN